MKVIIAGNDHGRIYAVNNLGHYNIEAESQLIGVDFEADVEAIPMDSDTTVVLNFMDFQYALNWVHAARDCKCQCLILVHLKPSHHAYIDGQRASKIWQIVKLLNAGADDVQPRLRADELAGRILALQRRAGGNAFPKVKIGNLTICAHEYRVWVAGKPLHFTKKEFAVLICLSRVPGRVVSKQAIIDQVYGHLDGPESASVGVYICKIRKKLLAAGSTAMVANAHSCGFYLDHVERECAA